MVKPELAALLADHLRCGDRVVIGQATSEPLGLVDALMQLASNFERVEAFCGYSLNPVWRGEIPAGLGIATYCGIGTISGQVARGRARIIPFAMSQLTVAMRSGVFPADIVLVQVSPADADGYHSLGFSADYVWDAARVARVVLAEVSPHLPHGRNPCRIHRSKLVLAGESDCPLPQIAREAVGEVATRIGREVAKLVPDGATIQLGIGKLAEAVALALQDRRGLKVRSGMAGEWLPDLIVAGAIEQQVADPCLASLAVGSLGFYHNLTNGGWLGFAQPQQLVVPIEDSPFMAINSAIEVDLRGQANAEFLGDRYVGASSGQPDYFRAARASVGGLAILAIPAGNDRGDKSRVVSRIASGYVTTAQSDLDFIVTEYGIADLRATDFAERRKRIVATALPQQREALLSGPDW